MASPQRANPFATTDRQQGDAARLADMLGELLMLLRRVDQNVCTIIAKSSADNGEARSVSEKDAAVLSVILPALGVGLGPDGRCFSAAEALAYLKLHGVEMPVGSKRLGKLFGRCVGIPVAGFRVRRDGKQRGALVWRIWRV